jgi:hypothetical protein
LSKLKSAAHTLLHQFMYDARPVFVLILSLHFFLYLFQVVYVAD